MVPAWLWRRVVRIVHTRRTEKRCHGAVLTGTSRLPALVDLLEDRRPIRAVGYWRSFHPPRTTLRYQDAANQILNEVLPDAPYMRRTTSSYFFSEDANDRATLIDKIRKAWIRRKEMPDFEQYWSAVDDRRLSRVESPDGGR
jgi:hypothetical protein